MTSTLVETIHKGIVRDHVRGFDVIDCEACGFVHVTPLPTAEEVDAMYREDYYAREKPDYLEKVGLDQAWYQLGYRERFDVFERWLSPERRRLVDIGCGPGFLLAHGQQRGWQVLGIEPSRQAAAHARGLGVEVIEKFFDEAVAREIGLVDAVQLTNVLEHIAHPIDLLTTARDLLAPGGVICVVVPNDYNPLQDALRAGEGYAPWWVAPPHHLNYFTFDSLERVLHRIGFSVVERTTTFPMELFLLMGHNYVTDGALGRQCHEQRMRLEQTLAAAGQEHTRRDWYRACAALGLGREVVVMARKN